MTVKAAATALEWSTPKIWRIETGATSMRSLDVEAMCKIYGALPEITEALMGLAKETRAAAGGIRTAMPSPSGSSCTSGLSPARPGSASTKRTWSPACCRPRRTPPGYTRPDAPT